MCDNMLKLKNCHGESEQSSIRREEHVRNDGGAVRVPVSTVGAGGRAMQRKRTEQPGILPTVLERHPDKLAAAAEQTYVVALEDYSKVPRAERPAYFATLNTYELDGQTYSVGAGLKMQDKLKQVARLLALCGEPVSAVSVQGYEIPELRGPGRAKRIDMDDFMD